MDTGTYSARKILDNLEDGRALDALSVEFKAALEELAYQVAGSETAKAVGTVTLKVKMEVGGDGTIRLIPSYSHKTPERKHRTQVAWVNHAGGILYDMPKQEQMFPDGVVAIRGSGDKKESSN